MGMFDMLKNAKDMVDQAKGFQQGAMKSQQAAAQPVNLNDPMKNAVMGLEAVNKYAESKGVPSGAWQKVQNGWVARMGTNEPVRMRFGNLYNEFLK